ncbi:MAG: SDR family NAD(P)-dependent oxidoreductase, partial [Bradymonadaceae bacterium]
MAETHEAFLQTMRESLAALEGEIEGEHPGEDVFDDVDRDRPGSSSAREHEPAPRSDADSSSERRSEPPAETPQAPSPIGSAPPELGAAPPAPTTGDAPAKPEANPGSASATDAESGEAPAAENPEQNPEIDAGELLLDVVADVTGYPEEMLDLEMDLESELGIDSIEQVEIVSEVQERVPALPELDNDELAELRELREVADYIDEHLEDAGGQRSTANPAAEDSGAHEGAEEAGSDEPVDVESLLLSTISEKMGYPREMLDPGMDLESDLGVDSIKQAEILSEMEERLPNSDDLDPEEVAELQSIEEVVEYAEDRVLGGTAGADEIDSGADPTDERAADEPEAAESGIRRYAVRTPDAPACGWATPGLRDAEQVCVTRTDTSFDEVLVDQLRERGVSAELVDSVPEGADALIHLGGLSPIEEPAEGLEVTRAVFRDVRAFAADRGDDRPAALVLVEDLGGDAGLAGRAGPRAWSAGLGALAKTLGAEFPETAVEAVDLSRNYGTLSERAGTLADELLRGGPETEVGFGPDGTRVAPVAIPAPLDAEEPTPPLAEDSVVVVSGGARGITATCVERLAQRTPLRFVLLGRTELAEEPDATRGVAADELERALMEAAEADGRSPSPRDVRQRADRVRKCREIERTLEAVRDTDSEATYVSVDVRDGDALAERLDPVRDEWGEVRGLIHGAGVLEDAPLGEIADEEFDRVLDTKVGGLKSLLEATSDDPLELVCLFSSVAARTGNPGQAAYAAANETLNKVAATLAQGRTGSDRVVSIEWGPWKGGMVTPALEEHFERRGVDMLDPETGAERFVDELYCAPADEVEVAIAGSVPGGGLESTGQGGRLRSTVDVDADSHGFLDDHRIDGTPVVPVVLAAEWCLRIAEAAHPGRHVRACRDLSVNDGIVLPDFDDGGRRLRIAADPTEGEGAGASSLEISLRGNDGSLHYTATVEMAPEPPEGTGPGSAPEVPAEGGATVDLDRVYGTDALFHGPAFRAIDEVTRLDTEGAAAELRGLDELDWPEADWRIDPAAVDGALQVAR